MISAFDIVKLNALLRDFHRVSCIYATVLDDGFRVLAAQPDEVTDFCRLLRGDGRAEAECRRCDAEACRTVAKTRRAFAYMCHAGLMEAIAPLSVEGLVVGYIMFGHGAVYPSHEEGWAEVGRRCRGYDVDQGRLKGIFWEMPLLDAEFVAAAQNILTVLASHVGAERLAYLRREELPVKIDEYLSAHFAGDITPGEVCRQFGLGRTKLYEIMKESYGTGFAGHVRRLRLGLAKDLMEREPTLPLAEVAARCGFGDYNYFITVFKKATGLSPGQYKKAAGGHGQWPPAREDSREVTC